MCQELLVRFGWSDARIPTNARQLCVDQLSALLPPGAASETVTQTAGLVISELVTNSVQASTSRVTVTFTAHRDHVQIVVHDDAPELPRLQTALPTDTHGRGLMIVQALSSSWGVEVAELGKRVWALVPFPTQLHAAVRCTLGESGTAGQEREKTGEGILEDQIRDAADALAWLPGDADGGDGAGDRSASDELLLDVLDRTRTLLSADTAAVLLRDGDSNELLARAARGLEEEVRQGLRLPIGRGFAGGIAATGQARALDHVDPSTVVNPILWRKGIRTMLGVPLHDGAGGVLGVLHVGRLSDQHFTAADAELLQAAASRVVNALQSHRLVVEAAAANLLEHSLLPTRMPRVPGLEFAARYVAAESQMVGGDWYDAYTLPSGDLCVIVGDVAGHGLNAAVIMGRLKSALRAYTLIADTPERMLELADRKMQHFEFGTMVTVICGVAKPPFDRITLSCAGHPPPILAAPDADPALVPLPIGPPLGVAPGIRRESATVPLPAGGALVLYTDGLVERRSEPISDRIQLLRASVPADHAETVCHSVMNELVGATPTTDDIALLVIYRSRSL